MLYTCRMGNMLPMIQLSMFTDKHIEMDTKIFYLSLTSVQFQIKCAELQSVTTRWQTYQSKWSSFKISMPLIMLLLPIKMNIHQFYYWLLSLLMACSEGHGKKCKSRLLNALLHLTLRQYGIDKAPTKPHLLKFTS